MQEDTLPHDTEKAIEQLESKKITDRIPIRSLSGTELKVYGYICVIRDSKTEVPYGYGLCIATGYNRDVIEATNVISQRLIDCRISRIDRFSSNLTLSSWVSLNDHGVDNIIQAEDYAAHMRSYLKRKSYMLISKFFDEELIKYLITGDKVHLPKASDDSQSTADLTCDIENTGDVSSQDCLDSQKSTWCTSFYQWTLRGFYKFSLFLKNMFQKKS